MRKRKLQYFGHWMRTDDSLENSLVLGNIEGRRRRRRQRWLDGITDAMNMNLGKLGDCEGQGGLACCSSQGHKESDTTGQLNNSSRVINDFVSFLYFSEILPKFSLLSIIIFTGRRKDYLPSSQFYLHSSLHGFKQVGSIWTILCNYQGRRNFFPNGHFLCRDAFQFKTQMV